MDVAGSAKPPIDELDAELEGRPAASHHLGLVEADGVVEILEVRKRRLANADSPDFVGLDQVNSAELGGDQRHEPRGRHPSCGTPAENHDFQRLVHAPAISEPCTLSALAEGLEEVTPADKRRVPPFRTAPSPVVPRYYPRSGFAGAGGGGGGGAGQVAVTATTVPSAQVCVATGAGNGGGGGGGGGGAA